MNSETIVYCVVALLLGMLMANMLKNVCGCKVEGNSSVNKCNEGSCICGGAANGMTGGICNKDSACTPICIEFENERQEKNQFLAGGDDAKNAAAKKAAAAKAAADREKKLERCKGVHSANILSSAEVNECTNLFLNDDEWKKISGLSSTRPTDHSACDDTCRNNSKDPSQCYDYCDILQNITFAK